MEIPDQLGATLKKLLRIGNLENVKLKAVEMLKDLKAGNKVSTTKGYV